MSKNFFGDELYMERAQKALPILIRQARCKEPIYYQDLANELEMPNPRNLNFVLGSIGTTLKEISDRKSWKKGPIPQIQSLVINQRNGLPGDGFNEFLSKKSEYENLTNEEKQSYLDVYWGELRAYPYWSDVLKECKLLSVFETDTNIINIIEKAQNTKGGGSGGEGTKHRALKKYISEHPEEVGINKNSFVKTEAPLLSGDKVDVLFEAPGKIVGVEVKSEISNDTDLIRGLFQCIKYKAVLNAENACKGLEVSVETVLVIGRTFPKDLIPIKNSLGIRVVEITA